MPTTITRYIVLLSENQRCHFAFGSGLYDCIAPADGQASSPGLPTPQELAEIGFNETVEHQDVMASDGDTKVTGVDAQGQNHLILTKGDFVGQFR